MTPLVPLFAIPAILALAYAQFRFVSESSALLRRPRSSAQRRRWRYGRRLAAGWLVGGALGLVAWRVAGFTPAGAAIVLVGTAALVALPASIAHRRRGGSLRASGGAKGGATRGAAATDASGRANVGPDAEPAADDAEPEPDADAGFVLDPNARADTCDFSTLSAAFDATYPEDVRVEDVRRDEVDILV